MEINSIKKQLSDSVQLFDIQITFEQVVEKIVNDIIAKTSDNFANSKAYLTEYYSNSNILLEKFETYKIKLSLLKDFLDSNILLNIYLSFYQIYSKESPDKTLYYNYKVAKNQIKALISEIIDLSVEISVDIPNFISDFIREINSLDSQIEEVL